MEHITVPMIPFAEALGRTMAGAERLGSERVTLALAENRVLAEDIDAPADLPAFDYSAMDGYALRTSDLSGGGRWQLPVRGESRAGVPLAALEPASACRIFTGAALPDGADAVVMQENVRREGDRVTIERAVEPGHNVRRQGSDLRRGQPALRAGQRLHPGRLGLLATLDRADALVARQPRLTIISTGDELRPPGQPGPAGSIPESNSRVIAAIAARVGARPRFRPLLGDDAAQTQAAIEQALAPGDAAGSDVLVSIGGVSVGDHDLVRPAMEAAGVEMEFWGVAIKPGKPLAVGRAGATRVLCLPGNPASATLTFLLFGVPLLRALQGETATLPLRTPTRVLGSHRRRPGREEYLRARLELQDGEICAILPDSQSSGAVTSFADADALVVLPADRESIDSGDRLAVIRLRDVW